MKYGGGGVRREGTEMAHGMGGIACVQSELGMGDGRNLGQDCALTECGKRGVCQGGGGAHENNQSNSI